MLKTALHYVNKHGWNIFPCKPLDKTPLTPNGLYAASNDEHDIKVWWEQWPNANIGLPCGKQNGFFVLDIDLSSGGFESLKDLPELPMTYAVKTGNNGLHYYFKYIEGLKNRVGLRPGIDLRTDGGYVIADGSKTTGDYKAITEEIIADAPQWLVDMVKQHQSVPTIQAAKDPTGSVLEGGRNNYLASVAGLLRNKDISEQAAIECLQEENAQRCNPPLNSSEVVQIVKSVYRYQSGQSLASTISQQPTTAGDCLSVSVSDLFQDMVNYLSDDDLVKGTPTGIADLDELIGGGKRLGEITAWHAVAKTGKNAFWHKMIHLWLKKGVPMAYASRELVPFREVMPNLFSIDAQENAWKMRNFDKYKESAKNWNLYFAKGYGYFPLEDLIKWVSEMKAKGVQYFFFDHLHYMLLDPEDHKEASILIKTLKTMAIEQNIHIDIIVQPNQLVEGKKLGLGTIKGGAAIGQAIDTLILLERVKDQANIMKVTVDVARSTQSTPGSFYMQYQKETRDFILVDKKSVEPPAPPPYKPLPPRPSSPIQWNKNSSNYNIDL